MDLNIFNKRDFLPALKALFEDLQIPINYLADEPTSARTILKDTWKDTPSFKLINTTAQFIVDITVKRVYGAYQQGD